MKMSRAAVPGLFTALNIYCGFLSIVYSGQGLYTTAAWLIIVAAAFDSLDGVMARMAHASSQFGVELDSLADVVSFGAAPSLLVYHVYLHSVIPLGFLIAAFPVIFGAIRLARFNVQLVGFDKEYFNGLPIPMQAITLCAFILQIDAENYGITSSAGMALLFLVVLLSILMVSHVKYDTAPKLTMEQLKVHRWKVIIIVACFCILVAAKLLADTNLLFFILAGYVVFGLLRAAIIWLKKISHKRMMIL
jgi:CDP-diacylglycerol--serine O-phosphatidyltransferase